MLSPLPEHLIEDPLQVELQDHGVEGRIGPLIHLRHHLGETDGVHFTWLRSPFLNFINSFLIDEQ